MALSDAEKAMLQTMERIALTLPDVPEDTVESQLVTFDMLIGLVGGFCREPSAKLLRETAARCRSEFHRERIERAAGAVAAGLPCALTPEGLTAQQAAQAATVTLGGEEIARLVRDRLEEVEEELDELDAHELVAYGTRAERLWVLFEERNALIGLLTPPRLPVFSVADFFPGLAVRVAQDFTDFDGGKIASGEVLHFVSRDYFPYDGGYTLAFREKVIRLAEIEPANEPVIENQGNAYFVPLPDLASLRECLKSIDAHLGNINPDDFPLIRVNVERCRIWLESGGRRPAPVCSGVDAMPETRPLEELKHRLRFLFAGVRLTQSIDR